MKSHPRSKLRPLGVGGTPLSPDLLEEFLIPCVRRAGKLLLGYFGRVTNPRLKESSSSVVCDADLAAERFILDQIHKRFPTHNIISEESGRTWRSSEYTWVIDPLDGTSNFVAGLPWFGVQIGLLHGGSPVIAAMFLPVDNMLYCAQAGKGAYRDGSRISVTTEKKTQNVLCAFGFDPAPARRTRTMMEMLFRISGAVRNTRATNSLVDFCYTADGRLGACLNMKTKVWDIVPICLVLPEAGGRFTGLDGKKITFELGSAASDREYAVMGANPDLHRKLRALL